MTTPLEGKDRPPETDPSEETPRFPSQLSDDARLKLEILQSLQEPCDRKTYGEKLRQAADRLGKSVRTVPRLVKKWQREGTIAVQAAQRSDRGTYRIDPRLRDFILKTYREGNKGSRCMTRKQVYIRTRSHAEELGLKTPSHMTVYRVLEPVIEAQEQKKKIRSPGWLSFATLTHSRPAPDKRCRWSTATTFGSATTPAPTSCSWTNTGKFGVALG